MKIVLLLFIGWFFCIASARGEQITLLDLTLEELGQLQFSSSATLVENPLDKTPASITVISREMIENSGARNLEELVDIHVSGLQVMRHHAQGVRMGLRGSVHLRKYLVMVNGCIMNSITNLDAITERAFPC